MVSVIFDASEVSRLTRIGRLLSDYPRINSQSVLAESLATAHRMDQKQIEGHEQQHR